MRRILTVSIAALAAYGLAAAASAKADSIFDIPGEVVGGAVTAGADIAGDVVTPFAYPYDGIGYPAPTAPIVYRECGFAYGCRYDGAPPPECRFGHVLVEGQWRRVMICE